MPFGSPHNVKFQKTVKRCYFQKIKDILGILTSIYGVHNLYLELLLIYLSKSKDIGPLNTLEVLLSLYHYIENYSNMDSGAQFQILVHYLNNMTQCG